MRSTRTLGRRPSRALATLVFSAFVIALGYGTILPVLPLMVQRLLAAPNPANIARHTGFLTAAFAVAPLATAFPWGRLSDRYGRRPILVLGLAGFAITFAATTIPLSLTFLYVMRLLNGGFAAAVLPSAFTFIADTEADEQRRARAFGRISVASSLGLLAGPMVGGLAWQWLGTMPFDEMSNGAFLLSFLVAGGAAVAAATVARAIEGGPPPRQKRDHVESMAVAKSGEFLLLGLAAVLAGGLGLFEVGLTLRSRSLSITPTALGSMLAMCMAVMLIAQGIVFSRLVKPETTRWLVAPAFAVMAVGLALTLVAGGSDGLLIPTSMVAASGGLLAPTLTYWISWITKRGHAAELGLQSTVTSVGQALGSAGAGLLYESFDVSVAFLAPAAVLAIAAIASLQLPRQVEITRPTSGPSSGKSVAG
ncbi:MFS transporter [Mesorhizobium sp. M4B.F.Ca.ET.049.02.1.2]|uniref:MFS transporter n=1 Tax=Mesorhizobium sp. M4B.F.Ca.ET.049.02.1.2 TaxID=2496752 RepID=UPI000FCB7BF8|nr:MFS transporter [Mesorhizobium sp. M4B.F.Ca.ET.049.02.1.2]RUW70745.1 MFS transporter [Mesorhizobium sp. M4B.F.Ca.ET.049.02.1.2]